MSTEYIHAVEGDMPVLLEMPHSGHRGLGSTIDIPRVLASKVRFSSEAVRRTIGFGCDAAVPELAHFYKLLRFGMSAVWNDMARAYCDTNRGRDEVSGLALQGVDRDKNHHGVIWARTLPVGLDLTRPKAELEKIVDEQCERVLDMPLTASEFETLMRKVYDPYHAAVREAHERILDRHGYCIHLALHTLPAFSVDAIRGGYVCGGPARRGPFDLKNNTLPDMILIHNGFLAADKVVVDAVRDAFSSAGLIVEDGQGPFLGDRGVTKIYGNPARGIHVIGLEHVTHHIEPERHLGRPRVDLREAHRYRPAYEKAVFELLRR